MDLVSQPLVQLAIATLIGFAVGWLVRLLFTINRQRAFAKDWGSRVRVAEHTRDRYEQEASQATTELASLRTKHEKSVSLIAEIEAALKDRDATIEALEQELATWRQRGPALESSLKDRTEAASRLEREVRELRSSTSDSQPDKPEDLSVTALEMQLEDWEARLPGLEKSLEERDAKVSALEEQVAGWRRMHADLDQRLTAQTGQLTKLERDIDEWKARQVEPDAREREQTITMLATELDEWKRKHARLERELRQRAGRGRGADRYPASIVEPPEGRDNLKKIRGIGPALEGTLNGLGIFRFQQIAELSEDDIRRIAEQLKTFPDRIKRDRWIDQARALQREQSVS